MARTGKLKVYRTAAGFHDAYVAAPSQKAALAAWGSERDLFARGIAELVTDPELAAEPLASPGVVIKRSRGTPAEQIAALPPREAPTTRTDAPPTVVSERSSTRGSSARGPSAPKPPPRKPKPSRTRLDDAERTLEASEAEYRARLRTLADREAALARQRRDLERSRDAELAAVRDRVETETRRYDDALAAWKR